MTPRRTARLLLRPPTPADLEALVEVEADPRTNRHRPGGAPDRAEVERHLAEVLRSWAEHGVGYWLAEHEGAVVGTGGLRRAELHGQACWNLYYRFRPAAWGRGLAGELAEQAVLLASEQQCPLPVVARTRPANAAAQRVAERAGLERRPDLDTDGFVVHARGRLTAPPATP